jgi:DNA-nicking Smr family endonuclease
VGESQLPEFHMSRPRKPSKEEIEEFRRSVGPVRTVRHDRISAAHKPPPPRPRADDGLLRDNSFDAFSDQLGEQAVGANDTLLFVRPGVQHRQLQQLRRGQFRNQAGLDLHGMNTAQARLAMAAFIAQCQARQIRHVRIIHGKGFGTAGDSPVLKNRINAWLQQHHEVLAFSSAQARDGGTGALYVLLRSSARE